MRLPGALARPVGVAWVMAVAGAAVLAGNPPVRLVGVSSRSDRERQVVVIEASDPVAYTVKRPDALTVLVDLRGVSVAEGARRPSRWSEGPVQAVSVEQLAEPDGAALARVRLRLEAPVPHRVRSAQRAIHLEFAREGGIGGAAGGLADAASVEGRQPPGDDAAGSSEAARASDLVVAAPAAAVDPFSALGLGTPRIAVHAEAPVVPRAALDGAGDGRGESKPAPAAAAAGASDPAFSPPPAGRLARQTPPASPAPPRYQGQPISLDFQGADLRAVLRTFAEISGLNMVIAPSVQGTVDVVLTDVPWDQALEIILRDNRLGYTVDGNVVRIVPVEVLEQEEAARKKLAEARALAGELHVMTKALSYAKAATLKDLITRAALSQRGEVQVDERTNTLIIRDLQANLETAERLIADLDKPEPQVEIEARIVQTTRDFARALGIQWGVNGRMTPELGNTSRFAFPNRGVLDGRTGAAQGPGGPRSSALEQTGTAVNLPVPGATSALGLMLSSVNGSFNLDVALSALERSGRGRILSTPRVTTQNNQPAEVTQGIQIPIQTVANNTVTVTFKDAALTLKVTPQITAADTVIMRIELENASPDFSRQVNNIPPIDTQRAITQVQVVDGATTVIGGIFVSREQTLNERTPLLNRIPLLGWLFRRDTTTDESRELLIFITPRILRG
jgi:type IV pilus secretin PilQ/predicted competence protein